MAWSVICLTRVLVFQEKLTDYLFYQLQKMFCGELIMRDMQVIENIFSAICCQNKRFSRNLEKALRYPDCKNTHDLSATLTRLLVLNDVVEELFQKSGISVKKIKKIRKFRKSLGEVRDSHELLAKLEKLEYDRGCSAHVLKKISKQLDKQKISFVRKCRKLLKSNIDLAEKKKLGMEKTETDVAGFAENYLQMSLFKMRMLFEQAIVNSDDLALHRLRIKFKAFRYAYELFAAVGLIAGQDALEYLHSIQIILGEAHDWLVILNTVGKIGYKKNPAEKIELLEIISGKLQQSNQTARKTIREEWENIEQLAYFSRDINS